MKLAFYKGRKRLLNRLIASGTGGIYSHTEVILEESLDGSALCGSSSIMDGGVRVKTMFLNPDNWDIVTINSTADARAWFIEHDSAKYDYVGMLSFALPFCKQDNSKWFCSEACAAALGWPLILQEMHPNALYKYLTKGN